VTEIKNDDLSPTLGGDNIDKGARKRVRDAVGKVARAILGPEWWPSCGLCSWRARFSVSSRLVSGGSSHGYTCTDHLSIMVGYSTDNNQSCTVEPIRRQS